MTPTLYSVIGGSSPSCWEDQASYSGSGVRSQGPKPEVQRVENGGWSPWAANSLLTNYRVRGVL